MTDRNEIDELYHTPAWQRVRANVLARDHYLCQVCLRKGIIETANTVHHKVHAKDDPSKFFDEDNLEAISYRCHNKEHPEKWKKAWKKIVIEKRKRIETEKAKGVVVFEKNRPLW